MLLHNVLPRKGLKCWDDYPCLLGYGLIRDGNHTAILISQTLGAAD